MGFNGCFQKVNANFKYKKGILSFVLMFVVALLSGCASSQKSKELETVITKLKADLNESTNQNESLKSQLDTAKTELAAKSSDSSNSLNQSQVRIQELESLSKELESQLGTSMSDQNSLKDSVAQMKKALQEMKERETEAKSRIEEYDTLKNSLNALANTGALQVKIVDGRMVVALPGDVLFTSGSAWLSKKGQKTIDEVAKQLTKIPERKFQIEGHTDIVPINTEKYPSNWDLASARALNVLKQMVESGMDKNRLSAASFGPIHPVASNDTPKGRASNRRIEIIVVPDLSKLPGFHELSQSKD